MTRPKLVRLLAALVAFVPLLAACGGDGGSDPLVVYSGRNENLLRPLLDRYATETGQDIHVRYGDTSELVPTILEEGDRSRADVFLAQDAGGIAALARRGLLEPLPTDVVTVVPASYRDPQRQWVGVTGRSRVIAYNPSKVRDADLPDSTFGVADPRWRGRVGIAPTNASFVAHISALREAHGDATVEDFLRRLRANEVKRYDSNVLIVRAIASGEIDLGLVNHYYALNARREDPDASVANHFPARDSFVNVSAVAVLKSSERQEAALGLVRYLLSRQGQEYFTNETDEYPMRRDVAAPPDVPPLEELPTIDIPLTRLGEDLRATTELIKRVGLS